ncbi:hypothetical protein NECID01_0604 [Nematocida sp. AWRm77]|nr:hypothetical protein NECID01_0604 [Nematocida sp. AWRm77]
MAYYVFKHPYVLIEDETEKHKPFYKEYDGASKNTVVPVVVYTPSVKGTSSKSRSEKKAGVCEMCIVRYSDYEEHILEKKHIFTAKEVSNYAEIDSIIEFLKKESLVGKKKTAKKQLFL